MPQRKPGLPRPKNVVTRGEGNKTVTISLDDELLKLIDARRRELDQDRSTYLRRCARLELEQGLLDPPTIVREVRRPASSKPPKAKRAHLRDIDTVSLRVFGTIPAGWPQQADESSGAARTVRVRRGRFPEGAFGLDVRGDSMNSAQPEPVLDGQTVILLPQDVREPRHGDIVAALCDGETTLKRLVCLPGKPCTLHAESTNPAFTRDIVPAHDLLIQGVVVGKL